MGAKVLKQDNSGLYFIAILPPEPVLSQITQIKKEFRNHFGSSAALRSPPHITLHMPFKWQPANEGVLINSLEQLAAQQSEFNVCLQNFGCFEPRVIFVQVEFNEELIALQKQVITLAAAQWKIFSLPRGRPFKPHITMAFRDLKKAMFHQAWPQYQQKTFKEKFLVDSLTLLKHNGKTWDIYHQSTFGLKH